MDVRTLSQVAFEDGFRAWSDGFEGYPYAGRMTMGEWLAHIAQDEIDPEISVVAFDGARPVGIALSGMREMGGRKEAYNGGTGVATDHRGQGVGTLLIRSALERYRVAGAHLATLEVVTSNDSALRLYRREGYEIRDRLSVLEWTATQPPSASESGILVEEADAETVAAVPFYRSAAPWQCRWQSIPGGRAAYLRSETGKTLAYALLRRRYREGVPIATTIYQAVASPESSDAQRLLEVLVARVLGPVPRSIAMNIPASESATLAALTSLGYHEMLAQYLMRRSVPA